MQAILLSTSTQNKLTPLTDAIPKLTLATPPPILPIANRPVMAIALEVLARHGLKDILISLYDRGGSLEAQFGRGHRWGVQLNYSRPLQPWGTAYALKWAERSGQIIDTEANTLIILPADSIVDLDLEAALAFHRAHQAPVTMILHHPFEIADSGANRVNVWLNETGSISLSTVVSGVTVNADDDGDAVNFGEEAAGKLRTPLVSTGAYILESEILQFIPPNTDQDILTDLLPSLLAAGQTIYGFQMKGYWNPLDSLQAYQNAQETFLKSACQNEQNDPTLPAEGQSTTKKEAPTVRYPTIEGFQKISKGIWVGHDHVIHPNVRIIPPVCIGNSCRIGRGVELGPYTVIGSNVIIDDEATISHSTILDHTYVGQLVNINNWIVDKTLVIDTQTGNRTKIVDEFLLAETSPAAISSNLRRLFDIVSSLFLLYIFWPFMCIIGVLTFFTTGHLFSKQTVVTGRPGQSHSPETSPHNGRNEPTSTCKLWRFKTRHADGQPTPLGRWIEQFDWHRLPELWNVLTGELGLVGVKPLLPEEAAHVTEGWQHKRYDYPAGFTGLWYLQTTPESHLDDVLIADAYYAATRTWHGDLKLAWQMPLGWFEHVLHSFHHTSAHGS